MIDASGIKMPSCVLGRADYSKLLYFYALTDPTANAPYYVGSSINPASRYLTHLTGQCYDSAPRTLELVAVGTPPVMRLLDVSLPRRPADRYALEGWWMAQVTAEGHALANKERYTSSAERVARCPLCYRSYQLGTLA